MTRRQWMVMVALYGSACRTTPSSATVTLAVDGMV
jgi:hypothetical protein